MDRTWHWGRGVVTMIVMGVREMVMGNGSDVLMRYASLVSELVSVAIELGPIGGEHCTMHRAQYKY